MRIAVLVLTTGLLLIACKPEEPVADKREPQGREETRSIRNTEAIGYSGDAIADKVDSALDANDQRNQQLQQADQ